MEKKGEYSRRERKKKNKTKLKEENNKINSIIWVCIFSCVSIDCARSGKQHLGGGSGQLLEP